MKVKEEPKQLNNFQRNLEVYWQDSKSKYQQAKMKADVVGVLLDKANLN